MAETAETEPKTEGETPAPEPSISPRRQAAFDAITAARQEMLSNEGFAPVAEVPDPAPAAPTPEPPPEIAPSPAAEPSAGAAGGAEPSAQPEPEPRTYTVVLDGKPTQVTEQELVAGYQIQKVARQRLEAATALLTRARAAAPPADEPAREPAKPPTADTGVSDEDFVKTVRSISLEDPEEGAKALKQLVDKISGTRRADPAQVTDEITQRVLGALQTKTALETFGNEFQDILSVPELGAFTGFIARQTLDRARQEAGARGEAPPELATVLTAAGNRVRSILGMKAPEPGGTQDSGGPRPGKATNGNGHDTTVSVDPNRVALKRAGAALPTPRRATQAGPAAEQPVEFSETADLSRRQSAIEELARTRRPQPAPRR